MRERTIFNMKHIIDATVKSMRWGLIDIESAISYRVELDDFEPIFSYDEKMREFEELLRFRDERIKLANHIKVLAYGKDKDNKIIALVLMKDLTKNPESLAIIAYDMEKELEVLRKFEFYAKNPQLRP
jgi:hypothetical protein